MAKDYTVNITKHDDSTIEIDGSISWEAFARFEKQAFERLGKHLELDGFRKGHVPEDVAKKHLGDELILTDMAELAIAEFYPTILKDEDIDAIGRPQLAITKIARGNELGFTLRSAVLPEIKLPDYKKIAKDISSEEPKTATLEEVDKVVEDLRQLRAYGHVHNHGDDHSHTEPLPEVTDEFAASFGEFKTVAELRTKIEENLNKEKVQETKDKRRIAILESIAKETTFTVPEIIIQSEQEKMIAQIEMDITRGGFSMEEYLKQVQKTREQLLEEFKPEAEKRARVQLVINAIARDASITVSDEEVNAEAEKFAATYPGADKARTIAYADMLLTNEKVLSMLEA